MPKIMMEGPDGSGKSTTGGVLAEILGLEVYHSGGPIKNEEELHTRIQDQLSQTDKIVDRSSVFSEPVYGFAIRKYSLLGREDFDDYIKKMVNDGWVVIWCTTDGRDFIEKGKKWKSEKHMKGIMDNYRMLQVGYQIVMDRAMGLGLKVIPFDHRMFTQPELISAFQWLTWQIS